MFQPDRELRPYLLLIPIGFLFIGCFQSQPHEIANRHLEKAKAAENDGDYEKALSHYLEALKIAPKNVEALYGVGEDYYRNGHLNVAQDYFNQVVALDSRNARAYYRLGRIARKNGDLMGARQNLTQAVTHNPELGKAFLELAEMEQKEEPKRALEFYEHGLQFVQDDAEAFYDYGKLLFADEQWDRAGWALSEAVRLKPEEAKYQHRLGATLRRLDRNEEAAEALKQAATLEPTNLEYKYTYASALKDVEQWEEAIAQFADVLKIDPNHEESLYKIASCYESAGYLDQAKEAYATAAGRIVKDKHLKEKASSKLQTLP